MLGEAGSKRRARRGRCRRFARRARRSRCRGTRRFPWEGAGRAAPQRRRRGSPCVLPAGHAPLLISGQVISSIRTVSVISCPQSSSCPIAAMIAHSTGSARSGRSATRWGRGPPRGVSLGTLRTAATRYPRTVSSPTDLPPWRNASGIIESASVTSTAPAAKASPERPWRGIESATREAAGGERGHAGDSSAIPTSG